MSEQIRGICAFVVVVAHAWQIFLLPLGIAPRMMDVLAGLAVWAVATFFILSGMMIAFSLERRTGPGQFDFTAYIWARILRIFPVLYLGVALTLVVVTVIQLFGFYGAESYKLPSDVTMTRDRAVFEYDRLLLTLTLTYNLLPGDVLSFNGPLWSLSYEFWMYILAGFLWLYRVRRAWWSAAAAVVLVAAMLLAPRTTLPFWVVWVVWGSGFLAGLHWPSLRGVKTSRVLMVALAFGAFVLLVGRGETLYLLRWAYGSLKAQLIYVGVSAILLCGLLLLLRRPRLGGAVGVWLTRLGSYSYTLYAVHFPLMWFVFSCFRPSILKFGFLGHAALALVSVLVSLAFAALSARLVENRPLLNRWFPVPKT